MVTLKSDNLTDLWAQRLVKFFGWNTREQNKQLFKRTSQFYNIDTMKKSGGENRMPTKVSS